MQHRPLRQALPGKFRSPAQPARQRREATLEGRANAGLGAEMIDENDFTARLEHANKLAERGFRIGHGGDDVLRHNDIEYGIAEAEVSRVHYRESVHIGEPMLGDALLRLAQHRRRYVDADKPVGPAIIRQRQAGADADFEYAPADALGRGDRRLAATLEHRAEYQIVDRRPPRIGFGDGIVVELGRHPRCERFSALRRAPRQPPLFAWSPRPLSR